MSGTSSRTPGARRASPRSPNVARSSSAAGARTSSCSASSRSRCSTAPSPTTSRTTCAHRSSHHSSLTSANAQCSLLRPLAVWLRALTAFTGRVSAFGLFKLAVIKGVSVVSHIRFCPPLVALYCPLAHVSHCFLFTSARSECR